MNKTSQLSDMMFASMRKLEAEELVLIESALADMACVISAHQGGEHHEHHGRHFKVAYDPSCCGSQDILAKIAELGVEARIVGL